jgi:hypothetical protein
MNARLSFGYFWTGGVAEWLAHRKKLLASRYVVAKMARKAGHVCMPMDLMRPRGKPHLSPLSVTLSRSQGGGPFLQKSSDRPKCKARCPRND